MKITKQLFLLAVLCMANALAVSAQPKFGERPKLVVGIVVDQMRWDYLSRYYEQFQQDGFRRLTDKGFSCDNCLINYLPTVTSIGHASVYTGSTPAFHGICGNTYFDNGHKTYCTEDTTVNAVGTDNQRYGQMSPCNLLATTIGDQLRLHTDFASKVIGVSYKDRAAILPAGRAANAAYWLDPKNGQFITSTYYMTELPEWVNQMNRQLKQNKELKKVGEKIGYTPLCGTITTDMAIAALRGEQLGQGEHTDMLCISYSQTDVIGHEWGTRGQHTDEAYLQLDKDIARLLHALDEHVGRGQYLLFLTADHGGAHNDQFLQDHRLAAGKWHEPAMKDSVEAYVAHQLGNSRPVIQMELDYRFFLDRQSIAAQGLDFEQVKAAVVAGARQLPHVQFVVDYERATQQGVPAIISQRALMGYHLRRSGDVLVVLEPGYYVYGYWSIPTGTTHGGWNPYDAHIPLLFYGWQIPEGHTSREVYITDIAPTVCQLLHIQQPNACVGEAITEITK